MRILVVDEDQRMRELLRIFLSEAGYGCVAVPSYADAATLLARQRFDAVVSEIQEDEGRQGRFRRTLASRACPPLLLHTAWPPTVRTPLDTVACARLEKRSDFAPILGKIDLLLGYRALSGAQPLAMV